MFLAYSVSMGGLLLKASDFIEKKRNGGAPVTPKTLLPISVPPKDPKSDTRPEHGGTVPITVNPLRSR